MHQRHRRPHLSIGRGVGALAVVLGVTASSVLTLAGPQLPPAGAQEVTVPSLPLPDCEEIGNDLVGFDDTIDCEGSVGVFDPGDDDPPEIDPSELALSASSRQLDFRLPTDRGGEQLVTFTISRVQRQNTDPETGFTHSTAMTSVWPTAFNSFPTGGLLQQRRPGGQFGKTGELWFERVGDCPGGRDGATSCTYRVNWAAYQETDAHRVDEPMLWRVEFPWVVQRFIDRHDGDPTPEVTAYGNGRSFFTLRSDPPPPLRLVAEARRLGPAQFEFTAAGSGPDITLASWFHESQPTFPLEFGSVTTSFRKDFAAEHPEIPTGSHSEIRVFVRDRWGRTAARLLPFSLLSQVGTEGPLSITTFELIRIVGGVAELRAVVENSSSSTITNIGLVGARAPAGSASSTPGNVPSLAPGATVELTVTVPVDDLDRFTVQVEAFGTGTSGPVRSGPDTIEVEVEDPPARGSTTMILGAGAGEDRVEVASQDGFGMGDHVQIGSGADTETRRIGGFGSLVFTAPLARSHPSGTTVVEIDAPSGDTTGPAITITTPTAGQVVVEGAQVLLDYTCTDTGVGVEDCGGDGPIDGSPIDTSTPGAAQLTVEAWDTNGNPATRTVAYTVASLANRRFVAAVHRDLLGRPPSAAELDTIGVALDRSTLTRSALLTTLTTSAEWTSSLVSRFYQDVLGRPGEAAGVAFWSDQIRTGRRSVVAVAAAFYSSPEHFVGPGGGTKPTWIDALYEHLLGRAPDPAGRASGSIMTSAGPRSPAASTRPPSPELGAWMPCTGSSSAGPPIPQVSRSGPTASWPSATSPSPARSQPAPSTTPGRRRPEPGRELLTKRTSPRSDRHLDRASRLRSQSGRNRVSGETSTRGRRLVGTDPSFVEQITPTLSRSRRPAWHVPARRPMRAALARCG